MPRKKSYNEDEVIEKAMEVFWKNGFEMTSMQQLEKEMGINKFSIYASFGSKEGLFLRSIQCYKEKLQKVVEKLRRSTDGIEGIKAYFYDFITFSKEHEMVKGCLVTNTANELRADANPEILAALSDFTSEIRSVFLEKIQQDSNLKIDDPEEKADYLLVAMFGLSSASRVFTQKQLHHYIENIFNNL
ncbi:TetR/AcrR family transcriptional regulator [Algivirga pacifica]|uniref:TetR/AcrR family transcriptional regulator n=1 Tax=Algivirga pacifica TaxID=1162670 RepID=A0ABP9D944_9BACT